MKLIKTLRYRPHRWIGATPPQMLRMVEVKVYENDDGLLDLHFENKGDMLMIIAKVCPQQFREDRLDYYWMGLEHGYSLAYQRHR